MRNVSNEWLAAISTGRDYSIDEKKRKEAVLSLLRLGCIRPSVKDSGT